jgi:uncharacterized protein YjbI with pentapeptide repeats
MGNPLIQGNGGRDHGGSGVPRITLPYDIPDLTPGAKTPVYTNKSPTSPPPNLYPANSATTNLRELTDATAKALSAFQHRPTPANYSALTFAHIKLGNTTPNPGRTNDAAAEFGPDAATQQNASSTYNKVAQTLQDFKVGSAHYTAHQTTQAGQQAIEEGHWHTTLEIKHLHRIELDAKSGLLVRRDLGFVVNKAILNPPEGQEVQPMNIAVANMPIQGAKTLAQAKEIAASKLKSGEWSGELMLMKSIGGKPIEKMNALEKLQYSLTVAYRHAGPEAKRALRDMFTPAALLQLGLLAAVSAVPVLGQATDLVMLGVMVKTIGWDKAVPFVRALWDAAHAKDLKTLDVAGKQMAPLLVEAVTFLPNVLAFGGALKGTKYLVEKSGAGQGIRIKVDGWSNKFQADHPGTSRKVSDAYKVFNGLPVVGGLPKHVKEAVDGRSTNRHAAPTVAPAAASPTPTILTLKYLGNKPNHPVVNVLHKLETYDLMAMLKTAKNGEPVEIAGGVNKHPVTLTKKATDQGLVLEVKVKLNGKEFSYSARYDTAGKRFVAADMPGGFGPKATERKQAQDTQKTDNPKPDKKVIKPTRRLSPEAQAEITNPPLPAVSFEEIPVKGSGAVGSVKIDPPKTEIAAEYADSPSIKRSAPHTGVNPKIDEVLKATSLFAAPGDYKFPASVSVRGVKIYVEQLTKSLGGTKALSPADRNAVAQIRWRNAVKETFTKLESLLKSSDAPTGDWGAQVAHLTKQLDRLKAQGTKQGWSKDVSQLASYTDGPLAVAIQEATRRAGQGELDVQYNQALSGGGAPNPFQMVKNYEFSMLQKMRTASQIAPVVIADLTKLTNLKDVTAFVLLLESSDVPNLKQVAELDSFKTALKAKRDALNSAATATPPANAGTLAPPAPSSGLTAATPEQVRQLSRAPVERRGKEDFLVLDPNLNWKTADLGRLISERQAEHLQRTKKPLNIDFSRCNLDGVDLSFLRLDKARFNGASLKKANLKNAKISGADFEGANLAEAVLTSAQGRKVNFKSANLTEANFKDAFLPRSTFTNADLTKADFSFADLFASNFQSAVVKDTFFGAAVLGQATFEPLHRYGPQPAKPAFESAYFVAAHLQGTIFRGVDDSLSTFDVGGRRSIGNVPNPFRRKALDANNERLQWLLNQENWKAPDGLYPEYKPENVAAHSVVIELPVPGKMRQELKEQFREVDPATRAIFAAIETPAGQAALNKFFGTKNYVYRLEDWGIRTQVTGPFSQVRKFYSYENLARMARNPGATGTGVYANGASRDGKGTIVRELHIDEAFVKAGLDEAAKRGFEQAKEILKKPGEKETPLDGYDLPKMIGVTEFFELSHRRNVKSGGVIETAPGSGEYKLNLAYDAKTNTYVTMADLEFKSIKQHESDLGPVKGRRIVYPGGGYGRLPAGTHLAPEVAQRLTWALKHPAEFVRAGKVNKAENNEPLYRFWVIKPLPEAAAVRNEKVFDDFRHAIQFPSNDAGATYRFDIGANTDPGKAIGKGLGIPTNLGHLLKLLDIDMPVPDLTRHKIEVGFAFKFHGEAKPGTQPPALPPTRP